MPDDLSALDDARQLAISTCCPTSQSIEWYAKGQACKVDVNGVQVTVRLVGRKGRRARIAITGPAGAVFQAVRS